MEKMKPLKALLNENISLSDVLQLKEMLNEWIRILSERTQNTE